MKRRLTHAGLAGAILVALLVTACGNDPGWRRSELPSRPQTGGLQFVNLISNSPSLQVEVGASTSTVSFGDATGAMQLGIGDYTLSVTYTDADGEAVYLIDHEPVELADEDEYVYWFTGSITQPTIQTEHFIDPQYGDAIELGTFEVWFANAASAVGEVDVYVTEPDTSLADEVPIATVASGGVTETFTLETQTEMQLRVTERGSTTPIFDSGTFQPLNGSRSLIPIVDYFGPTSATQTVPSVNAFRVASSGRVSFTSAELPSQMRVIDLIEDVDQIDVYFGSTSTSPLIGGVSTSQISPYVDVTTGIKALNVTRTGVKDQFLVEGDLVLTAGNFYTLLLVGKVADDSIRALISTTETRPIESRVAVQFMNATDAFASVAAYFLSPGQPYSGASPQISGAPTGSYRTLSLRPTIYDFVITSQSNGALLYGPDRLQFEAGKNYVVVLLADPLGTSASARILVLSEDA